MLFKITTFNNKRDNQIIMEYKEGLKKAGLTGNETKVYYELLQKGSLSANDISKGIGMDRTLVYTVLNHLIEKGLANYVIKDKKKFFDVSDTRNLLNPLKEKEAYILNLIKDLGKVKKVSESKHDINVYEGKEGIRTLIREVLKSKSYSAFGATGRAFDALYEMPRLVKEVPKKVFARVITSPKYKKHAMTKISFIQFRFLDIKSDATTSIFGDNVAIHILTQKPVIIVIKSKEIAESYQSHFEVLWKAAKKS